MENVLRFFICVHSPPDHLKTLSHCLTGRYSVLSFLFKVFISCWGVPLKCGSLSLPVTSEHAHILWPLHLHLYLHVVTLYVECELILCWDSLVDQMAKNLPAIQEIWVQSQGQEDPREKEMATYFSILAPRIPWMEEPGRAAVQGDSPQSCKESDMTEQLSNFDLC